MGTEIYWFSGTGNSLSIARTLNSMLSEQGKLLPMAALYEKNNNTTDADVVGFVFPIHLGDAPWVVKEFVKKTHFTLKPYIFAVATCNANPHDCLPLFHELLKKCSQTLALGEIIEMPGNALVTEPNIEQERLDAAPGRVAEIGRKINNREIALQKDKDMDIPANPMIDRIYNAMKRFKVSSQCDGCETCQTVCPLDNISLVENTPQWGQKCTACWACFHWCPQEAITIEVPTIGNRRRYHHPDITVTDIASQHVRRDK